MKRVVFFLGCLFLFSGALFAQTDNSVAFDKTIHDFGYIEENGGRVSCEFILTNNTEAPIVISKVTASCGCTTPNWTREPIEPGATGKITAAYNPKGRPGGFSKTVTVHTSASNKPYMLRIKGTVGKGAESKEAAEATARANAKAAYTQRMGTLLLKKNDGLSFGQVTPDAKPGIELEVFNDSQVPFTLNLNGLPAYLKASANPASIPAQTAGVLKFELDASAAGYGNHEGSFNLNWNNAYHKLSYSALVADDFSGMSPEEKATAPRLNTSVNKINFGDLSKGKTRVLKFSNSGKSDLNIKMIQSSDPLVKVSTASLVVKPNEIKEIKVTLDAKKGLSGFQSTLTVFSDDPANAMKTISVTTTP